MMLRLVGFSLLVLVSAFHLRVTRIDTVTNTKYLRLSVRINNASKDNTIDGSVSLLKKLDGILLIEIAFFKVMGDGRLEKAYALPRQNYCTLLRYSNNVPFIRAFLEQVSKYGTIPMSCPIQRGYYYVKNCTFTGMSSLPPSISTGDYQVRFRLVDGNGKSPILGFRLKAYLVIEID